MSLLPHGCTRVIIKLCKDCQRYEEHVPQKSAIYKVILGGSIGLAEVSEAIYQKHLFLNQIKKEEHMRSRSRSRTTKVSIPMQGFISFRIYMW